MFELPSSVVQKWQSKRSRCMKQILFRGEWCVCVCGWVPGRGRSVQRSHRCRRRHREHLDSPADAPPPAGAPDGETEHSSLFHTWHRWEDSSYSTLPHLREDHPAGTETCLLTLYQGFMLHFSPRNTCAPNLRSNLGTHTKNKLLNNVFYKGMSGDIQGAFTLVMFGLTWKVFNFCSQWRNAKTHNSVRQCLRRRQCPVWMYRYCLGCSVSFAMKYTSFNTTNQIVNASLRF